MADEWTFRTTTGRATVADGRLRISGSLRRMLREKRREGWTHNDAGRRFLFAFSIVGSVGFLARVVPSTQAVLAGTADAVSLFVLGCFAVAVLAVAYRARRARMVCLREVAVVRRVDDDHLRVECEDADCEDLDVETPTEEDADDAVEIFRLRGVPVEDGSDSDATGATGFRERLRANGA